MLEYAHREERRLRYSCKQMNENFKYGAAAVAVVGLSVGAVLYFGRDQQAARPADPVVALPAAQPESGPPAIKHPLPVSDSEQAMPSLDTSGPAVQGALADLIGKESVQRFFVTDDLVRHVVVTIDNLTEQKVAERLRPIQRTPGAFTVTGSEEQWTLDPANFERYRPMVEIIRNVDTAQLVASYSRYYPLFQEAYENLGHPPQHFNDRLIEVIDVLLATPDVKLPIALAQPGLLYEFADPQLENLPAGQKVLIRMGSDNANVVKARLRELRAALVAR